jgi:cell wall-associated NlpC family hydrolase
MLTPPANATAGLKALVGTVGGYAQYCVDLLDAGDPTAPPDTTALLDADGSHSSLTDAKDTGALVTAYDKQTTYVDSVTADLVAKDKSVNSTTAATAALVSGTLRSVTTDVKTLQDTLNAANLPSNPKLVPAAEGPLFTALLSTLDTLHGLIKSADATIQQYLQSVADSTPSSTVTSSGSAASSDSSSSGATSASYVAQPAPTAATMAAIDNVSDPAMKTFLKSIVSALGYPYVHGATGPTAFDCSGLVYWAAEQAGIKNMPRTSEEQYAATKNNPVSASALKPGDLIFPDAEWNNGNPGHVMIYAGNGMVISAPHTGANVHEEQLSAVGGFHATSFSSSSVTA